MQERGVTVISCLKKYDLFLPVSTHLYVSFTKLDLKAMRPFVPCSSMPNPYLHHLSSMPT